MSSVDLDAVLVKLKQRYAQLVCELELIKSDHPLNQPEMKSQDGGTTLAKAAKIKQLEDSIKATADAIERHLDLVDKIDGTDVFTIETDMGL